MEDAATQESDADCLGEDKAVCDMIRMKVPEGDRALLRDAYLEKRPIQKAWKVLLLKHICL